MEINENQNKKLKVLCLHGFRTSGAILQKLVERWPQPLLQKLDLVYMDGPYPARGKSDVDGIFEPPFYEWFQSDQALKEFYNFEDCLEIIQEFMLTHGPFDGVLGFSQGAILTASIPGMQREGVALTKVPKVKFVIIVSGAKFGGSKFGVPKLASASFSNPITTPSLHLIGETDGEHGFTRIICGPYCCPSSQRTHHTKARLSLVTQVNGYGTDDKIMEIFCKFIAKIQDLP